MFILNQKKTKIIPMSAPIEITFKKQITTYIDNEVFVLGTYADYERTKEVLYDIFFQFGKCINPTDFYQMPNE